ncbi:FRG domain-containing protein [Sinorhizobium sp. CB7]
MAEIEMIKTRTAREFLGYLHLSNDHWWETGDERPSFVFRGHADSDWDLLPSAFKPLGPANRLTSLIEGIRERAYQTPPYRTEEQIDQWLRKSNERAVLQACSWFKEIARDVGLPVPQDEVEMRALAQHHGVPTNLLDRTTSPLIAAFFAADDETPARIYAFGLFELQAMDSTPGVVASCTY